MDTHRDFKTEPGLIIVRIMGGLGNQMFQYALGRHLSILHQRPLKLDLSVYNPGNQASWAIRKFGLDNFHIQKNVATEADIARFKKYTGPGLFNRVLRRINGFGKFYLRSYILEPRGRNFVFDENVLTTPLRPVVYIDGFWQSEKYFKQIEEIIRKDFTFALPPDAENAAMVQEIKRTNSVALHIRHGDNVNIDKTHGVLPLEYYYRALDNLSQQVTNLHLYIFSDDPEWSKQNFKTSHKVTFVTHNGEAKDFEDLRLMSSCKHHIIGHSTFSWWAAWLGKQPGQLVYAPNRYNMGKQENLSDFYPSSWKLVDV